MSQAETFDDKKAKLIQRLVDEHVKKIEAIEKHTAEQCQGGKHLWESYATGGRRGHCVSHCLLCSHSVEGWD